MDVVSPIVPKDRHIFVGALKPYMRLSFKKTLGEPIPEEWLTLLRALDRLDQESPHVLPRR